MKTGHTGVIGWLRPCPCPGVVSSVPTAPTPTLGIHTHLYTVLTVEGNWACSLSIKASISRWMLAFSEA